MNKSKGMAVFSYKMSLAKQAIRMLRARFLIYFIPGFLALQED